MGGDSIFNLLAGVTTLFVIVVVLSDYKGVANILTGWGNLYGAAVGYNQDPLPYPKAK